MTLPTPRTRYPQSGTRDARPAIGAPVLPGALSRWSLLAVLVLAGTGCGAAAGADSRTPGDLPRRSTAVEHETCDIQDNDAEKLDANGDGRPDVTIVKEGGREVCRAVDLNFDGKIDSWVYRDASGRVRRREMDYDRDGLIEEVQVYRAGVLVEKQRATALASKLDTWHYFTNGQLARTERDSDGDAVVDQWWEYKKVGCPVIHSDINGDGKPDASASVDYCKQTGYVPPERSPDRATTSPSFSAPGALPTELSNPPTETQGAPEGEGAAEPAGGGSQNTGADQSQPAAGEQGK